MRGAPVFPLRLDAGNRSWFNYRQYTCRYPEHEWLGRRFAADYVPRTVLFNFWKAQLS